VINRYLSNLNGWQRIFIFIIIFLYLPVFILAMIDTHRIYERKYSDQQLNEEIGRYIKREEIATKLTIGTIEVKDLYDREASNKSSRTEIIDYNLVGVEFTSINKIRYLVKFDYKKNLIEFNEDKDILKLANFVQAKIDENKLSSSSYKQYIKIFFGFIGVILSTYFFGYMIAWIVKGFRQKQ
jgi:hypothetical protein